MRLEDVAMLAANTSRSRAYLQALVRHDLLPSMVLLLPAPSNRLLPGQSDVSPARPKSAPAHCEDDLWSEADFDATEPLVETLERAGILARTLNRNDINAPDVIAEIAACRETVFIYSGYGGTLLGPELLATGKRFLHVHGGYLPDFKGSTTNYYSLLVDDTLGASSLFLSSEIDSGPVLRRSKFPPPPDRRAIDHVFDAAARSKVLVETLRDYAVSGEWRFALTENVGGRTYFIIHPVLKHIAVLSPGAGDSCE